MIRLLLLSTIYLSLLSCHSNSGNKTAKREISTVSDTISVNNKTAEPKIEYQKTYEGILSCADCEGIKTTFKISKDFQSYELNETFLGKGTGTFTTSGSLNTERGFGNDKNATVYVLNYNQHEEKQRYFLRETGKNGQITALDKKRQKIESGRNQILKEIKQQL